MIVVTGVTAPLGRDLARALLDAGERVVGVARESDQPLSHPQFSYIQADLARARAVRRMLFGPARQAHTLVHAAQHRSAHARGVRAHRLHVESTRLILRLAEGHPHLRRFIYPSTAAVYQVHAALPDVLAEDQPLNLDPAAPQWVRDRVEADVTVCARMGLSRLRITVLRLAEVFARDTGSQLWDYLHDRLCISPLGYDPMINLLSLPDAVGALRRAIAADVDGAINIPGRDTLPLSEAIHRVGATHLPLPGPLLGPAYALRRLVRGTEFSYDLNRWRFHCSGILDGRRAADLLGYRPETPVDWTAASAR